MRLYPLLFVLVFFFFPYVEPGPLQNVINEDASHIVMVPIV